MSGNTVHVGRSEADNLADALRQLRDNGESMWTPKTNMTRHDVQVVVESMNFRYPGRTYTAAQSGNSYLLRVCIRLPT